MIEECPIAFWMYVRSAPASRARLQKVRRRSCGVRPSRPSSPQTSGNYGTHKHPSVKAWLAKNPRIQLHFTPTSGSWLNLVEVFFGIITRQAIRRGTFTSVKDLITAIQTYINAWNDRCEPFTWTKDADTILAKAVHPKNRNTQSGSETRH